MSGACEDVKKLESPDTFFELGNRKGQVEAGGLKTTLKLGLAVLLVVLFGVAIHSKRSVRAAPRPEGRNPVVVELFTSEGCSSCPPADRLLAKMEREQPFLSAEVIALEEHVDYWNNLGWTDPFSSDSATVRQYAYVGVLGDGNAYTPQMVVDGQEEFVGSRERTARAVIERAGTRKKAEVSVSVEKTGNDREALLRIQVGPLPDVRAGDKAEVWLAITETGLHSDVKRGENAGEVLYHAAVVRKLRKVGTATTGVENAFDFKQKVTRDPGWRPENLHIMAFVQEQKSKRILGAGIASFEHQS